ncbi:cell division protein FtsW [Scopulibacillus daqui]|uniref:Probable peptidoglycan glycosyltransferase FtsW n=1 Tax=Scopulibacillus daqui TaxID=1469162 RepID=A0ABS2PVZ9_9BACL|nr:FtsW/RodA/SpoVE family cell cycle protein [Scopulibacillus daqui]MBM7644222.1 cell division protein FtsW [Scopulibacillus daqui]
MLKKLFRNYDYSLIVTTLLLTAFGVIMVYSASMVWSVMQLGQASSYIFKKQLFWCFVAIPAGIVGMLIPYKMYKALVKPITLLTILMLIFVLLFGKVSHNAQSWIVIGPIQIQPAELAKMTVIIYLASVFSNKQSFISDFKTGVLPPLVMILLIFLLITIQPDLGNGMIIAGISSVVILCSGMRTKHLMWLLGLAVTAIGALSLFLLTGQQASRFTAAYKPFTVADSHGLQLINSYIAIASGGITGKGLGQSIEKAGFLPEPHTDFIMAIVAEELGLIGVLFVILCLAYLIFKGFVIGIRCKDVFGSLLAIGISGLLAIQSIINLGAMTGLLPVTGVTLPFVSYGGTSLVMMMFTMGVLVNISSFVNMKRKKHKNKEERNVAHQAH